VKYVVRTKSSPCPNNRKTALFIIMLIILISSFSIPVYAAEENPLVYVLEVEGTVTVGTSRYIDRGLQEAQLNQADACIISLNTPGGLVNATLDIIQDMSAAQLPMITYVNPEGGIAASAGTFILLNGHLAAMSPGTTCGAAMPVTLSPTGEGSQVADDKTINFLAGHMKSIARERGRPADLAEQFVTENLVLNNNEALDKGVVDFVAAGKEQLLDQIHGTEVEVSGKVLELNTQGARMVAVPLSTSEKALGIIGDPNGAYNNKVLEAAELTGFLWNVMWSVDPRDYRSSPQQIINHILMNLHPGTIIVLHEVTPSTTQALPILLQEIGKRGYRARSLSQYLTEDK
jgi:membrane-bound ClpP family serine protease